MQTDWFNWIFLPLLVFVARIADVALGTMRIIFVSRGRRNLAPLLGFVEVLIWISVVSQVVRGANDLPAYLSYAAGFAAGNYVGMLIEERLALGTLMVRVILAHKGDELAGQLRQGGFGVTVVTGQGAHGPVNLLYTIVKRKDLGPVTAIIHRVCPGAFFSVEEVRSSEMGIFPVQTQNWPRAVFGKKTK